ncbi:methyltransferase domain-containing protein [Halostreptopolyspora alba]|uniref:Methyltransferase domain-containing protein n=1 Tax=Halostreptopolyspora alba TaxID=2487137 RepID=A0A3N0EFF8_9ACTN|nr:methyltransferase domain-containing protein [Nocardiopsaceae bacterium YIM 96095]
MAQREDQFRERYQNGLTLVEKLGNSGAVNEEFELLGMEWDLVPGVFAPRPGTGTEWYTTAVPYPADGRFLEIGSGAGVTAVWAALHGCSHVTATDITEAAVRNTLRNVQRHGVSDRVTALRSDLFSGLDSGERFDTVFWNCSVIEAPEEFEYTREVEWAIFDRGYAALSRYLSEVHEWLLPGGRALVTFNSLGDFSRMRELAERSGVALDRIDSCQRWLAEDLVTFNLFEVVLK